MTSAVFIPGEAALEFTTRAEMSPFREQLNDFPSADTQQTLYSDKAHFLKHNVCIGLRVLMTGTVRHVLRSDCDASPLWWFDFTRYSSPNCSKVITLDLRLYSQIFSMLTRLKYRPERYTNCV